MARKWPPHEAMEAFVGLVNRIRSEKRGSRTKARWETVLTEIEHYGAHKCRGKAGPDLLRARDKLKADYDRYKQELVRRDRQIWSNPETSETAEWFVDTIERYGFQNGAGEWQIDWPGAVNRLHPDEPQIDVERLRARYESAVECCCRRYGYGGDFSTSGVGSALRHRVRRRLARRKRAKLTYTIPSAFRGKL